MIPLDNERQKAKLLEVKPEKYPLKVNKNLLTLTVSDPLSPGDELRVTYSFKLKIRRTDLWRKQNTSFSDTAPEPDIESDHSLIIQKARELVNDNASAEETAYKFYEYVASNISFNDKLTPGFSRSALDALKTHEGVCGHKANLLTAFCRASGIPARSVGGLTLPKRNKVGHYALGSHGWNEIYVQGKGWLFADPTYGSSILKRKRYWDGYDMYRASVSLATNPNVFGSVKNNLTKDCIPTCEMVGFPSFLLTIKKGSDHKRLFIRGDKMTTKVTRLKEPW